MIKRINKPWGYEELIEFNKKYMFKKLFMKKGHRCSLQFHNKKKETVYVLSGKLKLILKKRNKTYFKHFNKRSHPARLLFLCFYIHIIHMGILKTKELNFNC